MSASSSYNRRVIELLGLNRGYKAGLYYIQNLSKPRCYASIRYHGDENVLRGESLDSDQYFQKFRLDYVDGASDHSMVFCMLVKEEFGILAEKDSGIILGVNSVENRQAVYSLDDEQSWFLEQTATGYMIGQVSDGNKYTWHLGNKGEPIVIIADGSLQTQSWKFVPAK